jgi:hypothetical protein
MDREKAIELILDPGRRPPEGSAEHQAFLAYIEKSPQCRAMYEQQEAVWEALDLWEPVEPSAGFDGAFSRRIEQSRVSDGVGLWGWLGRPTEWLTAMRPSLAAGLAALLLVAGTIVSYQPERVVDLSSVQAPSALGPEYVEQIDQALDDIEMLADFEALVLEPEGRGKS